MNVVNVNIYIPGFQRVKISLIGKGRTSGRAMLNYDSNYEVPTLLGEGGY
eukprot:COSAG02_NODE_47085_length_343_cov_2.704918_1_plen_50_part_00